ncbi:MAG: helix-turn-helix domain-containing protein, partial [Chloroflexota bacterium]|nr:helix-turn-helix domain-containing protein [Chloroflexota bacterium]
SGPRARYGHQHLTRIRLIKQLQKHDVPLSKIRSVLESLDDAGVEQLLNAKRAAPDQSPAVDYIRGVLEGGPPGLPAPVARFASMPLARHAQDPVARGLAESGPAPPPDSATPAPATPAPATQPPHKNRSQWERLPLSPDVELHIRRPLSRHQIKQIDRLIHIATELFEEDTP